MEANKTHGPGRGPATQVRSTLGPHKSLEKGVSDNNCFPSLRARELVALAYQLGEGDTDDIVKLLEAWDKDKVLSSFFDSIFS